MRKWYTLMILMTAVIGSSLHLQAQDTTSIDKLGIFPNPATDRLTVNFIADSPVVPHIQIHDLTGKVVLNPPEAFALHGEKFKAILDISSLKTGIYFVKVIQADSVFSEKLVVR